MTIGQSRMESLENYELQTDNFGSPFIFIAKHKLTQKLFRLQGIPHSNLSENELKALLKKIAIRTSLAHPNILQFHGHFQEDKLYLIQEFCAYGTLKDFLQKECIEKGKKLHEALISRILYQTVLALKTIECFMGQLNLDSIFLSEDFNIKLYNFFNTESKQKQKEIKMSQLGAVVFELCTLKKLEKQNYEAQLRDQRYTEAFLGLIISMIKDTTEIKKHINKILCHPTLLLQSSQWNKDKCFLDLETPSSSETLDDAPQDYLLERLRRREAELQKKEHLLKEQERKLALREKKLQIMERTANEKLQQAELYLKRCREGAKSVSSGSSKSTLQEDPDYVTSGDSDVFPTSTKLHLDKIVKPQNFSRTLSERRIRFKTSPLKDHNFARKSQKKSVRHSRIFEEREDIENVAAETVNRRKSLFSPNLEHNVGWTEETKKYAFEMLRLMNGSKRNTIDVKHTDL